MRRRLGDWIEVDARHPCPICESTHDRQSWCLLSLDGNAVICPRVSDGSKRRVGDAGYLHILRDDVQPRRHVRRAPLKREPKRIDWAATVADHIAAISIAQLDALSSTMGVNPDVLDGFYVGWAGSFYSAPMWGEDDEVIGVQCRSLDGKKWCLTGSRLGLFLPRHIRDEGYLCITEGMSDAAALTNLGYDSIGRPSATCGGELVGEWLGRQEPRRDVAIFADRDAIGARTARSLAKQVRSRARSVRIITPLRGKDVRGWLQRQNVDRGVVHAVLSNATRF